MGGHETARIRGEDMGEKYMKVSAVSKEVSKGKGKGKYSSESTKRDTSKGRTKVKVMNIPSKIVPLPFLAEPPAEGTRGAKKRKKDGDPGDKE